MKALMGIFGGFFLTLAIFASGLSFATWLLAAKPVQQAAPSMSVADLWTRDARPVKTTEQSFARIPAKQAEAPDAYALAKAAPEPIVASNDQQSPDQGEASRELPAAHPEWCASRYRSYEPEDNSYRSYTGRRRPCISPYSDVATTLRPDVVSYVEANYASMDVSASADEVRSQLSPDHIDYCFSRYRSYRPEDNTYQPYSGGPRRECQ